MSLPCWLLMWQVVLRVSCHLFTDALCVGGSTILASVRENSPTGQLVSNISVRSDPGAAAVRWCLSGQNAIWFYLEGRTIRLNSSASRVLDREVLGPILIAELTCYEDGVKHGRYKILVEIINENDNKPEFLQETIQVFSISEVAAVNSVVFSVTAVDADGDMISYIIDPSSSESTSPVNSSEAHWPLVRRKCFLVHEDDDASTWWCVQEDAWFFRIDLPNSGNVVLNKPLDYESRTHLQLIMWAQVMTYLKEMDTAEKFSVSTVVTVTIQDVDDQYPHFLPCTPISLGVPVCMSPTYTANITHKHQGTVLDFSPGPIRAEDGDRGINSPLLFTILSGDDQGWFVINNRTGEVRLTRAVDHRRPATNFTLNIMVCQIDDQLKYSMASVVIRVLNENLFPLVFNTTTFKGFIIKSSSPASIVSTYGNQVLQVQVSDRDFSDGVNPNVRYLLTPPSTLYQVTQGGVLIARTDQLNAFDRHILQVVARDEESGEEVSASVDIEVLQRGQAVPRGALTEQQFFGLVDSKLAGGVAAGVLLMVLLVLLLLMLMMFCRRQSNDDASFRKCPNMVTSRSAVLVDQSPSRALIRQSSSSFHGGLGVYTRKQSLPPPSSSSTVSADSRSRTHPQQVSGGRSFQTNLAVVVEKPEGQTWPTLPDNTAGLTSTGESSDVPVGTSERDMETDQSEEP